MKISWFVATAASLGAAEATETLRYDAKTHVKVGTAGCTGGPSSTFPTGKTTSSTISVAGVTWAFQVKVPTGYDGTDPKPLIVQHPGWGYAAAAEARGCGIDLYADSKDFISVTVTGGNDNPNKGGPWYSWNAVGTTLSPGPDGPTCTSQGSVQTYCYTSCAADNKCPSPLQCSWTTCDDTGPTASGTGDAPVVGFIPSLYDLLESSLCVDTTREYGAGESNGGMMTYQLGVDLTRLAAVAPQFGSFHRGFAMAPQVSMPVLDIHGTQDTTVPANTSLSGDGYYYTTTAEIFALWGPLNGDTGCYEQYVTPWDGQLNTYCIQTCNGQMTRCMWTGGHNWFLNTASANGGLVTDFLLQWTRPSHVGYGNWAGEDFKVPELRDLNLTVVPDEVVQAWALADIEKTLDNGMPGMDAVPDGRQAHYGNPNSKRGCLSDEDVLEVAEGSVVCAPKVASKMEPVECTTDVDCANLDDSYCMNDPTKSKPYYCKGVGLPVAECEVGNLASLKPGCPTDAAVSNSSTAWPVCLGRGLHNKPYQDGDFHCLLSCPYTATDKDLHCPMGATCQRGELRHLAHGVCAYPQIVPK